MDRPPNSPPTSRWSRALDSTSVRLGVAALLGVLLHLALIPPAVHHGFRLPVGLQPETEPAKPSETREALPKRERDAEPEPKPETGVKLGRDGEPERQTVAWIAHDDFQELVARQSSTIQPALQRLLDPVAGAPLNPDPKLAAKTPVSPGALDQPVSPRPAAAPTPPPAPLAPPAPLDPDPDSGGLLALAENPSPTPGVSLRPAPTPQPATPTPNPLDTEPPTPNPNEPTESPRPEAPRPTEAPQDGEAPDPAEQPNPQDAENPTPPTPAKNAPDREDRPTSAPKDERETVSTTLDEDDFRFDRSGGVYVGPGLTLKPRRLLAGELGPGAIFAAPRNIRVNLYLDGQGRMARVQLLRSSGYRDIDEVVLNSLYEWTAEGELLERADPTIVVRNFGILLNPR